MNWTPQSDGAVAPALDLSDFRRRAHSIYKAREKALDRLREANREAQEVRADEGEADASYRKYRAQAFSHFRIKEDMGVTEAQIMADGSEKVVQAKIDHHAAYSLRRAAEDEAAYHREQIALLERNAASLRTEASMSEGL